MRQPMDQCVECGACVAVCELLQEIGQTPDIIAQQGISADQAFSCALCGACESACPEGLSPRQLFAERRQVAVAGGEVAIEEYRYLFPDRENNFMTLFRQYCRTTYDDPVADDHTDTLFFPGCTLMTYSPGLTRATYARLQANGVCQGLWTECCGKPLAQLGMQQRFTAMQQRLRQYVRQRRIKQLITACPGCYYELRALFSNDEIAVHTVYEVLEFTAPPTPAGQVCTIHDACPDRQEGKFAGQVRQALRQCGFTIQEMPRNREQTVCCGSGGQLSHFRPDLKEKLVNDRLAEIRQAGEQGATVLAGYCLSCVLNFDGKSPQIPVTHVLNLLLEKSADYYGAKERARQMLTGPEGEKRWEKMMADDGEIKGDQQSE